jgi:3-hydroxyacyl-[acyl-carrier-protein] dehydratase
MMSIEEINKILPQKPPFLMIDRVLEVDPGKRLVALKNVTINDQVLSVHFAGRPVMPGSLIIETMAQAGILLYYSIGNFKVDNLANFYLGSVKAHFFKPVIPGDQLKIDAVLTKSLSNGMYMEVKAFVGNDKVSESDMVCIIQK